jgi:hypothetical protein
MEVKNESCPDGFQRQADGMQNIHMPCHVMEMVQDACILMRKP